MSLFLASVAVAHAQNGSPNILIVISDDQSYPHASAYGARFVDDIINLTDIAPTVLEPA